MDSAKILEGLQGSEDRSNINHPFVKLAFVVYFMLGGSVCTFFIQGIDERLLFLLWLIFWVSLGLRSLDLKKPRRSDSALRQLVFLIIGLSPIIPGLRNVVDMMDSVRLISWLADFMGPDDVVGILYYVGAIVCISKWYFMDVLWIMNRLPVSVGGRGVGAFVTYFILRRYVSSIMNESISASRFKARIAGVPPGLKGKIERIGVFFRTLARQALSRISEVVSIADSHIEERLLTDPRIQRRDILVSMTVEDKIALLGIVVSTASIAVIFWLSAV